MTKLFVDLIGYIAATFTTASLIPQAWLIWKTRHTKGVSSGMYFMYTTGATLWIIYGFLINAWPVIISNMVSLALILFILGMKFRFG
jgi:MtN3 and saliva related transmembrane protein